MTIRTITLAAAFAAIALATTATAAPVIPLRASASPDSPSAGSNVVIDAPYQSSRWDKGVPPQYSGLSLAQALAVLLPPDLPPLTMEIEAGLDDVQLQWDTGLTRRQALSAALPADVVVSVMGGKIQARRLRPLPSAQALQSSRVLPTRLPGAAQNSGSEPGRFVANLNDKNLRKVVTRWASGAGWAFEDAYWAVNRDIPVMAPAEFGGEFKTAVLALLKTTEITDMPAKPCFYTNRVLRIVPMVEKCDKTKE